MQLEHIGPEFPPIKGTDKGPPAGGTAGVPFGKVGAPKVTSSGRKPSRARPHMLTAHQDGAL